MRLHRSMYYSTNDLSACE